MPNTVHLAAWNLNHRTGKKQVPPAVLHAIASLDADILVLTEFVDGDHQVRFKESLKDLGYDGLAVSMKASRQNQVLIASRSEMADDNLLPLPGYTEAAATNWLHRRFPKLKLEIVGLRAPMYLMSDERAGYWNQVETIAKSARDRSILFVGDFNCDPHTDTRPCTEAFRRLLADGFKLPNPAGPWSYHAPNGTGNAAGATRVDHAIVSPALRVSDARYLYKAGRHTLAGNGNSEPLSDHAALSIRIPRSS